MKFKTHILIIILFALILLPNFKIVDAQIPIGGRILTSYECGCSGGWFMLIYDQMTHLPIPIVFQFGYSMPRANYNIYTPLVQTLGSYTPGGICLPASWDCAGFATPATVSPVGMPGIGTGLLPGF